MRILVVEDSSGLRESLQRGFTKLGYAVDAAADGERGLALARCEPYDLLVLDIMLPKIDGLAILERLRAENKDLPVLLLTARDAIDDRVTGLRAGADDYLVKPFAFEELVARTEALLRRRLGEVRAVIEVGELAIDTAARSVQWREQPIDLTAREFALLCFLARRRGETVSRIEIEDHFYSQETFPMSNAVPAAISVLRSKLDAAGVPKLIHTRRGLGYVFEEREA